ncbi:MAG: glycosyltransferase family 4 protein [Solirubrobacteraceae bacterium]
MRVGVDARHLAAHRGVARYSGALLDALAREFPDDRWALFVPGSAQHPAVESLRGHPNVEVHRHRFASRPLFGAAAVARRPRLDRLIGDPLDLVWMPAPAPVAVSASVPLVLTVQDLSFERRPRDFTAYERLWHLLARPRSLARRAARVIVLARSTGDEIAATWGIPVERIEVVAPGVALPDPAPDPAPVLHELCLDPGGYLLAVGALEPRKAPELLAQALARAREQGLTADLVFAGEGRLAEQVGGPGVRVLGQVGDDQLDALYRGALALVVASLLEGYGLPLREALARGVPAVVSDLPSFSEELSPAVVRVAPGDRDALASALLRIGLDEGLRSGLAKAARGTVDGLTWEAAARGTRAVFAEVAAGRTSKTQ